VHLSVTSVPYRVKTGGCYLFAIEWIQGKVPGQEGAGLTGQPPSNRKKTPGTGFFP